jgi:hypothetical protein
MGSTATVANPLNPLVLHMYPVYMPLVIKKAALIKLEKGPAPTVCSSLA